MIEIAGLKKNVGFLNWVAGLAALAMVALYFILTAQIDSRFDKVDTKVGEVSRSVSDLRVEIATQSADIKAALEKSNDNPQASPRKR